jgi:hypothetical protein
LENEIEENRTGKMNKAAVLMAVFLALTACKSANKRAHDGYGPEVNTGEKKIESKNVIIVSALPNVRGFSILGFQEQLEEKKIKIKKVVTAGVSSLALTLKSVVGKKEFEWALLQLNEDVLPHSRDAEKWINPEPSKKKRLKKLLARIFLNKEPQLKRLNFDMLFFDKNEQRVRKVTEQDNFLERLIDSIWLKELTTTTWASDEPKETVFIWFKNELGPDDTQNVALLDLTTQIDADDYRQKKQAIYLGRQMLLESLRVLENL